MDKAQSNGLAKVEGNEFVGEHRLLDDVCRNVLQNHFCVMQSTTVNAVLDQLEPGFIEDWPAFKGSWNQLEPDRFMGDGGTYRFRRHATFSASRGSRQWSEEVHQAHFQSTDFNGLNGGISRHFSPISGTVSRNRVFTAVMKMCCVGFGVLKPDCAWHIEAHQFRIDASQRSASPTPEGVHRDGVSFVFMMLISRVNVMEGKTAIYDRAHRLLCRHTFTDEMEAAVLDDEHVMHGVSPIIQICPGQPAYRDVLVVTFSKR